MEKDQIIKCTENVDKINWGITICICLVASSVLLLANYNFRKIALYDTTAEDTFITFALLIMGLILFAIGLFYRETNEIEHTFKVIKP